MNEWVKAAATAALAVGISWGAQAARVADLMADVEQLQAQRDAEHELLVRIDERVAEIQKKVNRLAP